MSHWRSVQQAYPINERWVWLNNCGTTPPGRHITLAMHEYFERCSRLGPGSDRYAPESVARKIKASLSCLLGARPDEVALVHNTAEAITMVSLGMDLVPGDEILILENEYPSNVYPWEVWQERGVKLRFVPLADSEDGFIDNFQRALGPRTRVAALSMVHWCTGLPLPMPQIAQLCHERDIRLVIDGSQGVGQVPLDVGRLGPCAVAFSTWKWLLGPLGLGVLVVSQQLLPLLKPVFKGPDGMADSQYLPYQSTFKPTADRFTYSTANYNDWVYLAASLDWLENIGFERVQARIQELTEQLWGGLREAGFRSAYDRTRSGSSGILAVDKPGVDCGRLAELLSERGILARERLGRLRLAPHVYISPEQIAGTVKAIAELTVDILPQP